MRPFRSVLYMPGSNQRALEKAQNLQADALILDLEDAVADLEQIAQCAPDAILLPKVNTPEDITSLVLKMDQFDNFKETKIWAMMETPLGILNAAEIAQAHPKLEGFVLGTNDLVKDIHGLHTADRSPVLTALSISIMAARANGLICVDGVYNDIKNIDGLKAQAEPFRG